MLDAPSKSGLDAWQKGLDARKREAELTGVWGFVGNEGGNSFNSYRSATDDSPPGSCGPWSSWDTSAEGDSKGVWIYVWVGTTYLAGLRSNEAPASVEACFSGTWHWQRTSEEYTPNSDLTVSSCTFTNGATKWGGGSGFDFFEGHFPSRIMSVEVVNPGSVTTEFWRIQIYANHEATALYPPFYDARAYYDEYTEDDKIYLL